MHLSLAARSQLYAQLGKLLVAGFPFLRAVETILSASPRGATRQVLLRFQALAIAGATITEIFADSTLAFSPMETSLISACERSGQMQRGCEFLTRYFARLDGVRRQIIRRSIYPVFMLHFGVIAFAIPLFFSATSAVALRQMGLQLASFYVLLAVAVALTKFSIRVAMHSVALDRGLSFFPIIGGIRRSLALSRFCITYQMQLDAGVNVMDSLDSAGQASASAWIVAAVRRVLPQIRAGHPVGPELVATGAFPSDLGRALVIGEQTGSLDADLLREADEYEAKAVRGIETIGEWVPKVMYFIIVGFLAWNLIAQARSGTQALDRMMDNDN